jgi:hypothetical protein
MLRFGSVNQVEIGAPSRNQGGTSYEEIFTSPVQSGSASGQVDRTTGTVGSRRESLASDLDCNECHIIMDSHRRGVGDQHRSGEIS